MTHRHLPARAGACPGRERGLGMIAVLVVLVLLAGLAAALVRLSSGQQQSQSQSLLSGRANSAAASGVEWGAYQALKGAWTACNGSSQTLDLSADTGMWVTVSCGSHLYNEGESEPGTPQTVRVFRITAVACNAAGGCPNNTRAVQFGYVERVRQAVFSSQ